MFTLELVNAKTQILVDKKELRNNILQEKIIYFEIKSLSEEQIASFKDQRTIENHKIQYQEENEILKTTLENHWFKCKKLISLTTEEIETRLINNQETWYLSLNKHTNKFQKKRCLQIKVIIIILIHYIKIGFYVLIS